MGTRQLVFLGALAISPLSLLCPSAWMQRLLHRLFLQRTIPVLFKPEIAMLLRTLLKSLTTPPLPHERPRLADYANLPLKLRN